MRLPPPARRDFMWRAVKDGQNARQEAQLAQTADIYLEDYGNFEMFRKKAGI